LNSCRGHRKKFLQDNPRVFFAGEHLAIAHAWIQGAIQTGLVAVIQILNAPAPLIAISGWSLGHLSGISVMSWISLLYSIVFVNSASKQENRFLYIVIENLHF
jgi:hypothetical protein